MFPSIQIDGNWFNIATFSVAVLCIFVRPVRRGLRKGRAGPCWQVDKAITDFLNGLAVVPFAAMPFTLLSSTILATVRDNIPTLAAAGMVGFLYVSSEVLTAGSKD